jgi:hypothetical protein
VSKLIEDVRIATLGAAAALLACSVTLLIDRVDTYYVSLHENYFPYERGVLTLWWLPATLWHIILSVVASLVVHRYLATRVKSPFVLWQVVGITSLFGWFLTLVLIVSLECVGRGDLTPLSYLLNSGKLALTAKYFSTIFACNVFYGSVMNASSRQYALQLDPQIALNSHDNEFLPH